MVVKSSGVLDWVVGRGRGHQVCLYSRFTTGAVARKIILIMDRKRCLGCAWISTWTHCGHLPSRMFYYIFLATCSCVHSFCSKLAICSYRFLWALFFLHLILPYAKFKERNDSWLVNHILWQCLVTGIVIKSDRCTVLQMCVIVFYSFPNWSFQIFALLRNDLTSLCLFFCHILHSALSLSQLMFLFNFTEA